MAVSNVVNDVVVASKQKLGTAELLFQRADAMGLQPDWITPGGVFVVRVGDREEYVNFARSPLNSHANASLAVNKYLTRRILERNHMKNIPFMLPLTHADAIKFLATHGKIIAKPISGGGSRDIHIVTTDGQLMDLVITKYILEKYIAGKELRYLVLDDSIIGVHHSEYGISVAEDRQLQRISYPVADWDQSLVDMALHTTHVLGLRFAAVDFIVEDSGEAYVLEVNSVPGLKWFHAPTSGPVVDVAGHFLDAIVHNAGKGSRTDVDIRSGCSNCHTSKNLELSSI